MGEDRRLSEHLLWSEVRCKCGHCDGGTATPAVVALFERIRMLCCKCLGREVPVVVNSGYRCEAHNKAVGGATKSQHLTGNALDLRCPEGMTIDEFHGICLACNPAGMCILYKERHFVHVDCRGVKA